MDPIERSAKIKQEADVLTREVGLYETLGPCRRVVATARSFLELEHGIKMGRMWHGSTPGSTTAPRETERWRGGTGGRPEWTSRLTTRCAQRAFGSGQSRRFDF